MKKEIQVLILCLIIISITIIYISNSKPHLYTKNTDNLNDLAFYVETEEGSKVYDSVDQLPGKNDGYIFKKAVCDEDAELIFDNNEWVIYISNMKNNSTKCKLYFDKNNTIAKNYILSQNTVNENIPNFKQVATTNEGIFMAEDNSGTSYYYRGAVDNNYFYFAGYYWRIIRINGDGSIRIIYDGTSTHSNGEKNTDRYLKAGYYNNATNNNAYVGYRYTLNELHGTSTSSTVEETLNDFYKNHLWEYDEYISDTGFCNDRDVSSGSGIGTTATNYAGYNRLVTNKNPTLKCSKESDTFGVNIGNAILTYPIGLITADEAVLAGGVYGNANNSYYLYIGYWYFTMTPFQYNATNSQAFLFNIGSTGYINSGYTNNSGYIKPVININKNVELDGDGTANNPYKIVSNS